MNAMQRTKFGILLGIAGLAILVSLAACRKKNHNLSGGGSSTQSVITMKGGAR